MNKEIVIEKVQETIEKCELTAQSLKKSQSIYREYTNYPPKLDEQIDEVWRDLKIIISRWNIMIKELENDAEKDSISELLRDILQIHAATDNKISDLTYELDSLDDAFDFGTSDFVEDYGYGDDDYEWEQDNEW